LSPAAKVAFGLEGSHNVDLDHSNVILDRLVKIFFIFTRENTLFTREIKRSHVKCVQRWAGPLGAAYAAPDGRLRRACSALDGRPLQPGLLAGPGCPRVSAWVSQDSGRDG
jgi:hypothetical protein